VLTTGLQVLQLPTLLLQVVVAVAMEVRLKQAVVAAQEAIWNPRCLLQLERRLP
jgi:hypothetical protein